MSIPAGPLKEADIAEAVAEGERELAPGVVRIRYHIGEDWSGDTSVFFRVILSDKSSRGGNLAKATSRVRSVLNQRLKLEELGLLRYFNFRSQSEQKELREEAWS